MRASDFDLYVIAFECDCVGSEVLRLLTEVPGELDIAFDLHMTTAKDIAGDFYLSLFLSDLEERTCLEADIRAMWHMK